MVAASGAHSRSFTLRHHDWMQANVVPQKVAWALVPQPLNYRVSDTESAHDAPSNGGTSVSGADGVHGASGTLSRSFTLRHHAWMQANAVPQKAAWVLMPRPQIYSVSNAYRWAVGAENPAHPFRGQS